MPDSSPTADDDAADDSVPVMAFETRPGRVVFTVADSADAWIASDLTVSPER